MSVDTTTTLDKGLQIEYDNDFLKALKQKVVMMQIATKRPFPRNKGKTVDMVRYTRRSPVTAHLTEGASGTEDNMYIVHIRATLQEMGNYFKPSTFFNLTSRDPRLKEYAKVVGIQAAESIDLKIMSQACLSGGWPIRADLDTNFSGSGQVTTGGTDTFRNTNVPVAADNDFDGGHVVFYDPDGPNYLNGACIADSKNANEEYFLGAHTTPAVPKFSGGSEYPDALPEGITTADATRIACCHDLAATDVISYSNINMCLATLQQNLAEPFDHGYFVGIVDSEVARDLRADSDWKNVAVYKDNVKWLLNGELGEAYGIRWVRTTQPWRHAIDSYTYSASGLVHVVPIFGAQALGVLELSGQGKHIIAVEGPSKSDPLDMYQTIGWKVTNAVRTLNAFNSVLLLCGATALA